MSGRPWDARIARANELAEQVPAAAELLRFYARVATLQRDISQPLAQRAPLRTDGSLRGSLALDALLPFFPGLLDLVERHGPSGLAASARDLRPADSSRCKELLMDHTAGSLTEPRLLFFARALVEPYASLLAAQRKPATASAAASCPHCGGRPQMAVLRPEGEGARRSLLCSFCLSEWEFRRLVCPVCGGEDEKKLPVYSAPDFPHIRVECCDTCRHYLKGVDLSRNGLAEPVVDEIAAASLDLWAREHGYLRIVPNLLGL